MNNGYNLDEERWRRIVTTRVRRPSYIAERYLTRRRRPLSQLDGNLFLIAIDHPARGMLSASGDPMAMVNRRRLLGRLLVALMTPGVDGVMAQPDIIEDLLLLNALENKVAIGTMNRGGLGGSSWELDDRFTAYTPDRIGAQALDGGKMLLRIDDDDRGTLPTLVGCGHAISALGRRGLMAMIEPLPYTTFSDGSRGIDPSPTAQARAVAIAGGLGSTSAHTWLKIAASSNVEMVAETTSLPTLLLGGDPGPNADEVVARWSDAMSISNVRGLVVGRSLLYPSEGSVEEAVRRAAAIVHPELND